MLVVIFGRRDMALGSLAAIAVGVFFYKCTFAIIQSGASSISSFFSLRSLLSVI